MGKKEGDEVKELQERAVKKGGLNPKPTTPTPTEPPKPQKPKGKK